MTLAWEDACPATSDDLYDSILFDGQNSPGVVKLSGHVRQQNLDVKESDGQKGAATTWKGTKIGKFTATFNLAYDPGTGYNDFVLWDEFAQLIWSTVPPLSGDKPVAKDIWHPDLERNGFKSVILDTMGEMIHDGKGGATIAVTFSEYYPPKPAKPGNASGSKSNSKSGSDGTIDALTGYLNTLNNAGKTP